MRSEIKVTVTKKWYVTLRHHQDASMYQIFGIATLNNIGDMLYTGLFYKGGQSQCHGDQKIERDTPPTQDASTHQIWDSYLK